MATFLCKHEGLSADPGSMEEQHSSMISHELWGKAVAALQGPELLLIINIPVAYRSTSCGPGPHGSRCRTNTGQRDSLCPKEFTV